MKKIIILITLVVLGSTHFTCKKKEESATPSSPATSVRTVYTEYSPYEIIAIEAVNFTFPSTGVTCLFSGSTVEGFASEDFKFYYVMVPATAPTGSAELRITSSGAEYTVNVMVTALEVYPGSSTTFLTNYVDDALASLQALVSTSVNPLETDDLNTHIATLQRVKSELSTVSSGDADIIAQFVYTNDRPLRELDNALVSLDLTFLSSTSQRTANETPQQTTVRNYITIMNGFSNCFATGSYRKALQILLLGSLLGVSDTIEALTWDLMVAGWQGNLKARIASHFQVLVSIAKGEWWEPKPISASLTDYQGQLVNHYRVSTALANITVLSSTSITFNNFKVAYRNVSSSDQTSAFPLLQSLSSAYARLVGLWNTVAVTYFFADPLAFEPPSVKNKTLEDITKLNFTCTNPDIQVDPVQGTASSFSVKLTSVGNIRRQGTLRLQYTDALDQVVMMEYAVTVEASTPVNYSLTDNLDPIVDNLGTAGCCMNLKKYYLLFLQATVNGSTISFPNLSLQDSTVSQQIPSCTPVCVSSGSMQMHTAPGAAPSTSIDGSNNFNLTFTSASAPVSVTITGTVSASTVSGTLSHSGKSFSFSLNR